MSTTEPNEEYQRLMDYLTGLYGLDAPDIHFGLLLGIQLSMKHPEYAQAVSRECFRFAFANKALAEKFPDREAATTAMINDIVESCPMSAET